MDKKEFIDVWADGSDLSAQGKLHMMRDLNEVIKAAEARSAQLETDNDEMQSYINEIRVALHTEKDELTIDAVRRVISECDELARKLEMAHNTLENIKRTMAVGRNVGEDKEQAYQDAEEIADFALNNSLMHRAEAA